MQQRVAPNLNGPGEEVRFQHPLQTRGAVQLAALEQVGGVGLGQPPDVDAEGRLHHHADHCAQVGVPHEQVVHLLRVLAPRPGRLCLGHLCLGHDSALHSLGAEGQFAQGGAQQVVPQPPLDPYGLQFRVLCVERFQGGDVALVRGTVGTEVLGDALPVGHDVFQRHQRGVPQPFVQRQPPLRLVQGEGVGPRQTRVAGPGPAQQPAPAVGEDAHADPSLRRRLRQVVVQLPHVIGVGFAAGGGADAPLELDEGVQGGQVNGAPAAVRGRVLLDHLLGLGQAGADQEIADGRGDVGLRLVALVPFQDGGGGAGKLWVVDVQVRGHGTDSSSGKASASEALSEAGFAGLKDYQD